MPTSHTASMLQASMKLMSRALTLLMPGTQKPFILLHHQWRLFSGLFFHAFRRRRCYRFPIFQWWKRFSLRSFVVEQKPCKVRSIKKLLVLAEVTAYTHVSIFGNIHGHPYVAAQHANIFRPQRNSKKSVSKITLIFDVQDTLEMHTVKNIWFERTFLGLFLESFVMCSMFVQCLPIEFYWKKSFVSLQLHIIFALYRGRMFCIFIHFEPIIYLVNRRGYSS